MRIGIVFSWNRPGERDRMPSIPLSCDREAILLQVAYEGQCKLYTSRGNNEMHYGCKRRIEMQCSFYWRGKFRPKDCYTYY